MSGELQPLYLAGFILLSMALIGLPFAPALREWLRPTDVDSLTVPVHYSSQGSWFATKMRDDPAALAAAGEHPELAFPGGAATGARVLPGGVRFDDAVFSQADLHAAPGSSFTALMSAGSLDVGTRSLISEWAHADRVLRLHGTSLALRRLSAHERIELESGCCFERLNAPEIEFGGRAHFHPASKVATAAAAPASYAALAHATRRSALLYRVAGDCELRPDAHYVGSLVVTGQLTVGRGTVVDGDLKSHKGIRLNAGCVVNGAVISDRQVEMEANASALGPVTSETEVALGTGVRVGTLEAPTTISAPVIVVESGATAHGTVWARSVGTVWSMT